MEVTSRVRIVDLQWNDASIVVRLVSEEVDGRRIAIVDGPLEVEPTHLTAMLVALQQQAILTICGEFFAMNLAQRLEQLGASARRLLESDDSASLVHMAGS